MRILQVLPYFYPAFSFGGPVSVVYNISKELAKRGHEVTVYTSNALDQKRRIKVSGSPQEINGINIYYFKNLLAFSNIFITLGMPSVIKKEMAHFDVVHIHGFRSFHATITSAYALRCGKPYLISAHGTIPTQSRKEMWKTLFDRSIGYHILRNASTAIALSQLEANQYKVVGVPEEKIEVIPNGIDLSEYADPPPKGSFRNKFAIDDNEKIVLYLGRIHKLKGIDFLIKAYASLVKNGVKGSKLVIAGPDDGYLRKAKELACSSGISSNVLFLGFVTERDKFSVYSDSSVVVYLGQYEPFGLVSLEAAVFGKPVLIASGTPMARTIKKGNFGFSINYGDITCLADSLKMLLKNDGLAHAMGKRWRRYVKNNFDWKTIVSKIEAVYEDALT